MLSPYFDTRQVVSSFQSSNGRPPLGICAFSSAFVIIPSLICNILPLCPIRSKLFPKALWEECNLKQPQNPFFGQFCARPDQRPAENMTLFASNNYSNLTSSLVMCHLARFEARLEFKMRTSGELLRKQLLLVIS